MNEVFPVLAGVVLGLATSRLVFQWGRWGILGGLSVAFGAAASWISGELTISWTFLLIDVAQVLTAGAMTALIATRWQRRPRRVYP